jgi:hypothetical protein
MTMKLIANALPVNSYTMHSSAISNLVNIPAVITDTVMIEINPVLQMFSMFIAILLNLLEEISSQKSFNLIFVPLVVLISLRSHQFVTPCLLDNALFHFLI